MFAKKQLFIFMLSLVLLVLQPLAVLACATCGCSELCPLGMMQETETTTKSKTLLSDSLWGSIILKMAYQRDAQLRAGIPPRGGGSGVASAHRPQRGHRSHPPELFLATRGGSATQSSDHGSLRRRRNHGGHQH